MGIRIPATLVNPSASHITGKRCFCSSTTSRNLCPFCGMRISRLPSGNCPAILIATLVSPAFSGVMSRVRRSKCKHVAKFGFWASCLGSLILKWAAQNPDYETRRSAIINL